MQYTITYKKIKHGYVRLGNDGKLKLSIPLRQKNNKNFENKLIEKGEELLQKTKTQKVINAFGDDYIMIFGEEEKNFDFTLDKRKIQEILKDRLKQESIPIIDLYSQKIGKNYKDLKIKNLKTRWGSCSYDQKIVLNLKLLYLPKIYLKYVIIHEICHLKEKNHSKNFWQLVNELFPNYKEIRKNLKIYKII